MKTIQTEIKMFALLAFISCANAFAIGGNPVGNFQGKIYASGTYFVTPMADSSWANSNTANSTKANYANFDGETFVSLISYDKQSEIVIESKVKVAKGHLCIIIENSQGDILFGKNLKKDETITATLTLDVYEQYKIRFIGEETNGSYYCKWTQQ